VTGNNPAPWAASSVALLADPLIEHTSTVKMWNGNLALDTRVDVPAYDVQVTLSAVRVPFGEAKFKTPVPPWAGITWPTGSILLDISSTITRVTPVSIHAGWRRPGNVDDQQIVMNGYVTAAERRRNADGSSYVQWTVTTAEQLWEYPSHRVYDPDNTYTRVKQVTDYVNASADPWNVAPVLVEGTLNTPTSAQLASFRAADIAIGDTVGDYLRQLALILGQRVRPDWRNTTLRLRIDAEPSYDAANPLVLAAAVETSENYSYDNFGSILDLRAQWVDAGNEKTAARQFAYPGMFPNTPTRGTVPAVVQSKTLYTKPPSGAIPNDATWPPAALWSARISRSSVVITATSRAAWWIQPLDVITYTQPGLTVVADTITYDLDAGLMTVTGLKP